MKATFSVTLSHEGKVKKTISCRFIKLSRAWSCEVTITVTNLSTPRFDHLQMRPFSPPEMELFLALVTFNRLDSVI